MKTQTAMQLHKKIIQNVIESMNGELNSYQSGYKQCLIQVQNDIDETLLRLEKEQMMETWTKAIDQTEQRAWNVVRAYDDFDDYYNEQYGDDKCQFEAHLNSTSATKCKWCGLEKWQHKTYGGDK